MTRALSLYLSISAGCQLDALVFLRVYLLGRYLRNTLGFSATASPFAVHLIRAFHRVDVTSVWFTLKCAFYKFPFALTVAALLVDWVLTSAALNLVERCAAWQWLRHRFTPPRSNLAVTFCEPIGQSCSVAAMTSSRM